MFCLICGNFSKLSIKINLCIKFACANLALKTLAAKVLNSEVATYLS